MPSGFSGCGNMSSVRAYNRGIQAEVPDSEIPKILKDNPYTSFDLNAVELEEVLEENKEEETSEVSTENKELQ